MKKVIALNDKEECVLTTHETAEKNHWWITHNLDVSILPVTSDKPKTSTEPAAGNTMESNGRFSKINSSKKVLICTICNEHAKYKIGYRFYCKKIQTRRLFKKPLLNNIERAKIIWFDGTEWIARDSKKLVYKHPIICPYGNIGDLLWVKETWAPAMGDIAYKADYSKDVLSEERNKSIWHPSIHMPKSAARFWLEITGIKAERIQSISEQDASEEGCGVAKIFGFGDTGQSNHREGFFAKWISIYGIESYYENPWLWAIKFKVL